MPDEVYYVQMGDAVKIGWTSVGIDIRAKAFRSAAPLVLLATEPGGQDVESQRHIQFGHLRIYSELFRLAPVLLRHVADLGGMPRLLTTPRRLPYDEQNPVCDFCFDTFVRPEMSAIGSAQPVDF